MSKVYARTCECGEHAWKPLTKGFVTFVDAADAHLLVGGWYAQRSTKHGVYAALNKKEVRYLLGRLVLNCSAEQKASYRNSNTLDNRRANLYTLLRTEAHPTRHRSDSQQLYKGIRKKRNKYQARITVNKQYYYLGSFDTAEAASAAYQEAIAQYYPEQMQKA